MNPEFFSNSPAGRIIKTDTGFYAFMPNPMPPDFQFTSDLINALSEADRALGQLVGLGNSLLNPHLLI